MNISLRDSKPSYQTQDKMGELIRAELDIYFYSVPPNDVINQLVDKLVDLWNE